jgi:hypothetical protein
MSIAYKMHVKRKGDAYVACLRVRISDDAVVKVTAQISARALANLLDRGLEGRVGEVGFAFGEPFQGVLKTASTLAKAKALQKADKTVRSQAFLEKVLRARAVPGLRKHGPQALAAMRVTLLAAQAKTLKRQGKLRPAKALMRRAAGLARLARMKKGTFQRAAKAGLNMSIDPRVLQAVRMARSTPDGFALQRAVRLLPAGVAPQ